MEDELEQQIDDEFRKLIEEIDDDTFWRYIQSWKDETDLINQMLEWDSDTKKQAIEEIDKIIKGKKIRLTNYAYNPNNHICLECLKEFDLQTDVILCDNCMKLFDTNKLWKLHDENKIDVLDFNEDEKMRESFRIK